MSGKIVPELLHLLVVNPTEGHIGDGVEANEIEPAIQAFHQFDDGLGMIQRIVDTAEHYIFKREPTLVREIVIPEQFDNVCNRHPPLCGH